MSELLTSNEPVDDALANNGFWPDLSLSEFKAIARSDGTVSDARLAFDMQTAVQKINQQLSVYQSKKEADSLTPEVDDVVIHHYKVAVYSTTKAMLLESYRDVDSREKAQDRSESFASRIDHAYSQATVAVNDILGKPGRLRSYTL